MSTPVFHERTNTEIARFLERPAHAAALVGDTGAGKRYVAEYMAAALLNTNPDRLAHQPYYILVEPDEKGSIGIERARDVVSRLQLKTTGSEPIRRVVLIAGAETLTREAQNALLKAIEEPPADTVILCTIADRTAVLPTVLSRLQSITIYRPPASSLKQHFTQLGFTAAAVEKALRLSDGLPGLTHALLTNQDDHPFVAAIQEAKDLLRRDTFERLVSVDGIVADKRTTDVVKAMGYIADAALHTSTSDKGLRQWAHIQQSAHEAGGQLAANANAKLVLTNLFLRV